MAGGEEVAGISVGGTWSGDLEPASPALWSRFMCAVSEVYKIVHVTAGTGQLGSLSP